MPAPKTVEELMADVKNAAAEKSSLKEAAEAIKKLQAAAKAAAAELKKNSKVMSDAEE